jgi:adenine-specific DNA methylase
MFEQTFKNIDDVLWKEAGCTTELDYTEQTSWLLFLKTKAVHGKPVITNTMPLSTS